MKVLPATKLPTLRLQTRGDASVIAAYHRFTLFLRVCFFKFVFDETDDNLYTKKRVLLALPPGTHRGLQLTVVALIKQGRKGMIVSFKVKGLNTLQRLMCVK